MCLNILNILLKLLESRKERRTKNGREGAAEPDKNGRNDVRNHVEHIICSLDTYIAQQSSLAFSSMKYTV